MRERRVVLERAIPEVDNEWREYHRTFWPVDSTRDVETLEVAYRTAILIAVPPCKHCFPAAYGGEPLNA